ncbi:MAG TPA: iron ABC transporter permease [Clostridiaceae bacterium]|nr:iron ABC transporter permease [Clostridiaceae bacterium]
MDHNSYVAEEKKRSWNPVKDGISLKTFMIGISVAVLVFFVLVPMINLVLRSVIVDGSLDFSNYSSVYSASVNWNALLNTVKLAVLTMLLSLVITFPLAWLVGRTDLPMKKFFRTLFITTYMIPPYVGAIAWTQLLNPRVGYLNKILVSVFNLSASPFNIYTMGGLVWVLTLFYSPFAFITISRALEKMDPTLEEAARISGASPLKTLTTITIPLMLPSILAGGLLVFIAAGSCFGIPAIVGMPGGIDVITTRIVSYVFMGTGKGIQQATALAVALMLIGNLVLGITGFMQNKRDYVTISGKSTHPNIVELGRAKWPIFFGTSIYGLIAVFIPLGSILVTSMIKSLSKPISLSNLSLNNWSIIITRSQFMEPIRNSFITATIAATVGTLLALMVSYLYVKTTMKFKAVPDYLVTLGGATPSVVIALALIIGFSGQLGLNLYSTLAILTVAYVVKYLTMGVRTISASIAQVHISLEEAALNSGANFFQAFRDIMIPLIRPSIIAGWFLIFMPSFYELTMSILLYGSRTKTIGVLLYELETYADPQSASVLAVLILTVVLVGNMIIRKISRGNVGI